MTSNFYELFNDLEWPLSMVLNAADETGCLLKQHLNKYKKSCTQILKIEVKLGYVCYISINQLRRPFILPTSPFKASLSVVLREACDNKHIGVPRGNQDGHKRCQLIKYSL